MRRPFALVLLALVPLAGLQFAGCAILFGTPQFAPAVTGAVTYRARVALPPEAELYVALVEAPVEDSLIGPPPAVVADTVFATDGRQVPIPFTLRHAPGLPRDGYAYTLRAEIRAGGETLFETAEAPGVFQRRDARSADIVLVRPGAAPARQDSLGLSRRGRAGG